MGFNVVYMFGEFKCMVKYGYQLLKFGFVFGFCDLCWCLLVFVGDIVIYLNILMCMVKVLNYVDWLLYDVFCEGRNQDGKIVVNFMLIVIEFI